MKDNKQTEKILVTKSSMPTIDEFVDEIKELWDTHWLTNMGVKHQELQRKLEEFLDCPDVVLFTNGHLALESAIAAMNFPSGSEVITTPFTFISTTHAIVRNNLVPVFCDVNPDDYTIDTDKIEQLITDKTVAIIPVHVYGHICNTEKIDEIAEKHNLTVIYDGAHAFAEHYNGKSIANFGDMTMFSFHATKVFNTIEGGAVCLKNKKTVRILEDLKNFGIRNEEEVDYVGGNAKMSEFQAAMGICNLRHINDEILKRKILAERYTKRLSNIQGIKICKEQINVESNYSYFPVVFDNYKKTRNEIYELLKNNNIIARKYFYPLTNDAECYRNKAYFGSDKTPIAKWVSDRVLVLPLYSDLDINVVDKICSIIKEQ